MIGLNSPWDILLLGIPLVIILGIAFGLAALIRYASGGRRLGNSAVHAELIRIDERLTSIEKVLRDIE
jgi:hypothetical protein